MADDSEMNNRELMGRFKGLVMPFRWYLYPAMLCMVILAATNGAIAFLVQPVLDQVFIEQDKSLIFQLPLVVLLVFFVRGVVYFIQAYLMEWVGQKIVRQLQVTLYRHLLTLDLSFFLGHTTGSFISRLTYDANMMKAATSTVISNILREGLTVVFLIGVLLYRDPELALVALLGLPAAGFLIFKFGRRMRRLSRVRQEFMEGVIAHLEETISGLRIVKAFGMESYERARFRHVTKQVLQTQLKGAKVKAFSNPSMDMIAGFAVSGVILYGGQAVVNGATTTGTFFSFITALLMAYSPIKKLTGLNNALQESLAAARRIFELLDERPTITNRPGAVQLPRVREGITFRGVQFRYGENLPPVLDGIDLHVKAGERVAIVGRSGSGKTTLVNLVPRFFDVTGGAILIDGHDLREVTMESLRAQIAMVTQEIILFNDTVLNNLTYGSPDHTGEEVQEAARAANALAFIDSLPEGLHTQIGDRGVKLSGGQRQRLSIARSLLKNAPILILDEATSSLDTESELAVQEALERLMKDRTTLVIAHRLSTIRNADRIVVLMNGRIVEEGNHETLLSQGGEYARLYNLQFRE